MDADTLAHGKYYWCVKTNLSKDGTIYLMADWVEISGNGDLVFLRSGGKVNLAIASGSWRAYFPASMIDGSAVAVEHWRGWANVEKPADLSSSADRILQIVAQKGPLTAREIAQQTRLVNSGQAKSIIADMVADGSLIEIQSTRTCRYALPEQIP